MESILSAGSTLGLGNLAANANGIQDIIKSLSITGNIMLDTMILMNAYTFCKSYIEMFACMIKDYSIMFGSFIWFYLKQSVKSKLTGKIVFKCQVDDKHQMYPQFFKHIIESNISGDVAEDWKFKWLKIEDGLSDGKNYLQKWQYNEEAYDRPTDLYVNYFDRNQKLEFKQTYGMSDKVTKIFIFRTEPEMFKNQRDDTISKYFSTTRTFYIRVTWKKYEYGAKTDGTYRTELSLELILFDMPKFQISKSAYFHVLYTFLERRFKIFDTMLYTYSLTSSQSGNFYSNINNNVKYRPGHEQDGWTIYGNDSQDLIDNIIQKYYLKKDNVTDSISGFVNPISSVELNISPKDIHHDYKNDVVIKSSKTENYIYKYAQLGCAMGISIEYLNKGYHYGYFEWNDTVVLICGLKMWFAKIGEYITETDIQNIVQHVIAVNLNYTKNQAKTKPTTEKEAPQKKQVYVHKRKEGDWESHILSKRSFETIYLPEALKLDIKKEFNNFVQMQHLYKEYEIPYRKGVLFYGPPGTGKTSVVKAIAYEYQIPLYILDVNDKEINDDSIVSILNSLGGNGMKILLFEDIDTAFADKEKMAKEIKSHDASGVPTYSYHTSGPGTSDSRAYDPTTTMFEDPMHGGGGLTHYIDQQLSQMKVSQQVQQAQQQTDKKFLTYSGLLNALDGVMSNQTGVITIMTTNYIERLGKAFMRAGRIDCKFELKECNAEQIKIMVKYFVKQRIKLAKTVFSTDIDPDGDYADEKLSAKAEVFAKQLVNEKDESNIKPCDLQSYLLKHIDHIPNVFKNVDTLLQTFYDSNFRRHGVQEARQPETQEVSQQSATAAANATAQTDNATATAGAVDSDVKVVTVTSPGGKTPIA